jgi:nucleotide-binding universal stress UspA family protein
MAREAELGHDNPIARYEEMAAAVARNILDKAAQVAKSEGVSCQLIHVPDRHPAEGIIATAKDKGCDLIVMASHGRRGLDRILLGSTANEVVTHSAMPTLIVR